jgi:hypothetical protein
LKAPVALVGERSPIAANVAGKRFVFPQNPQAMESIRLSPAADDPKATEFFATMGGVEQRVTVAGGRWVKGELKGGPAAGPVAVSGAWTAADTFTLDVVRYRTPFVARYHLKFSGDGETVTLETVMNVGPTPPPVVGRRE